MKKTKNRHNKKRNTAFLFEALLRELTKSIIHKDLDRKKAIIKIVKEHFNERTILGREMKYYNFIVENKELEKEVAEELLKRVLSEYKEEIVQEDVYKAQSDLIKEMNVNIGRGIYSNFVPNYKTLATINQIFNKETSLKNKILLEKEIVQSMSESKKQISEGMKPLDKLSYNMFIKKFNKQYGSSLIKEQKELLNKYIVSYSDDGVELKTYLNEEIGRLKEELSECLNISEFQSDEEMTSKAKTVITILESFSTSDVTKEVVDKVLKIQNLVYEAKADVN
tara:strand:+ start:5604 stop:6446 length:843 start_codon:yes stop_codon:yes gene_type:complete